MENRTRKVIMPEIEVGDKNCDPSIHSTAFNNRKPLQVNYNSKRGECEHFSTIYRKFFERFWGICFSKK